MNFGKIKILFKRLLKEEDGFIGTLSALGALAGAAGGAAKAAGQQGAKDKATQLAAETARYSPWTHMDAGAAAQRAQSMPGGGIGETLGNVVGGASGGGQFGKSLDSAAPNLFGSATAAPAMGGPMVAPGMGAQAAQAFDPNRVAQMASSQGYGSAPTWQGMKKPAFTFNK